MRAKVNPRAGPRAGCYWDGLADEYQSRTHISLGRFHVGPLVADGDALGLLPADLRGAECLELGCGAGQNSICLAGRGARCTARDVSSRQLAHGRRLAAAAGVRVAFECAAMETLAESERYELVHTVYALPFASNPRGVVRRIAAALKSGGRLVLSTVHPLFHAEWLELDGEGFGVFLRNYFRPAADTRVDDRGLSVRSRAYPVAAVAEWITAAGLLIRRVLEPEPLPVHRMSPDELADRVAYYSDDWLALYPRLRRVPVCVVFEAVKL